MVLAARLQSFSPAVLIGVIGGLGGSPAVLLARVSLVQHTRVHEHSILAPSSRGGQFWIALSHASRSMARTTELSRHFRTEGVATERHEQYWQQQSDVMGPVVFLCPNPYISSLTRTTLFFFFFG